MAYKLAEEDKLCGVIYPTYEGFSPIPKVTCDMLESKCDKTEIIVKCKDKTEEGKEPESQSGSASASTSESNSQSESKSESTSTSESNSQSESVSTSESTSSSVSTSVSASDSQSTSASDSTSTSESKSDSVSASTSDSTSTSTSNSASQSVSTSESTTSISNSQSESTLVSTSESKSESISASGSTSLSNSTSTSTSVTNSLSTTEPLSESELASASLSELSSEEIVAHSNEISNINESLKHATKILNTMIYNNIYVRRGNPYTPMYLKETVLNSLAIAIPSVPSNNRYLNEYLTVNDVHIDPKVKMDSEHEPFIVPLVFDITLPWGGKRTMVVPTNVVYMDEDIEKPDPNPNIEGHTPVQPANPDPVTPTPEETDEDKLSKERKAILDEKVKNLNYNYGKVTLDGNTIVSITKDHEPVTNYTLIEHFSRNDVENIIKDELNKDVDDKYKITKVQITPNLIKDVGDYVESNQPIIYLEIKATYSDGSTQVSHTYANTAFIDTL